MFRRVLASAAAIVVCLLFVVPIAAAADPLPADLGHSGRVLIATDGDVLVPAGDHLDAVIVVRGHAEIAGTVNTLIAIDGSATLRGATAETVLAFNSPVRLEPGTVVRGDILTLNSNVHRQGDAEVLGDVRDIAGILFGLGAVLAPILVLIWLGFGLATIAWAWLLAALAASQVRRAERTISEEPLRVFAVGLLGLIVVPALSAGLIATIVGAPLGIGILVAAWPLLAFVGYLVGAIWIGDWILARTSPGTERERPLLASTIGVLVLLLTALVPVLTIVAAIASLFGFGALLVVGWRTLRGRPALGSPAPLAPSQAPAPAAS